MVGQGATAPSDRGPGLGSRRSHRHEGCAVAAASRRKGRAGATDLNRCNGQATASSICKPSMALSPTPSCRHRPPTLPRSLRADL
ncbi:unnamed protein product [Urochloa humidicola]